MSLRIRLLSLVASLALAAPFGAAALDAGGPFAALNVTSREAYAAYRAGAIAPDQPVFLVTDTVTLIKGGDLGSEPYTPPIYTLLKNASHVTLGVFGAAEGRAKGGDTTEWDRRLANIAKDAAKAREALAGETADAASKARMEELFALSATAIADILAAPPAQARAILEIYGRKTGPILLGLINDTAKAQIALLDEGVNRLKTKLAPGDWEKAIAVITGPKTPREGNLQYEYFVQAFGPGSGGKRVMYMESVFDREAALAIVRTILTDRRIGAIFFGEEARMERDLLADAATAELLRRFGKLGR